MESTMNASGDLRLPAACSMTSPRKLPGLPERAVLHQLAVHHHERLRNRPLEVGRLVGFVVGESEEELPQPGVALPVVFVAGAGAVRPGGGQQRVEKLFGRHRLELHLAEEPLVLVDAGFGFRSCC